MYHPDMQPNCTSASVHLAALVKPQGKKAQVYTFKFIVL